ncbi:MAG: 2-phosphosulfolactate phosphatase [Burkholderiales bacterium]
MPKVHVLLKKEDLDAELLTGKVVVVLDILFATSTIVTAFQNGVTQVIPALDEQHARQEALKHSVGTYVIAGEKNIKHIDGFGPPTPLALLKSDLAAKKLIYSTTNGTVALAKSAASEHVYAAALLNGEAVMRHVLHAHHEETILIVCSGSGGGFNLEDFYGAGYMVNCLHNAAPNHYEFSDAALASQDLFLHSDPLDALLRSRIGRLMQKNNMHDEVQFAAQLGVYDVIPRLKAGVLTLL